MKIIYLVAGGRAGSDFFQGFLDGHSQILQFPGTIHNYEVYKLFQIKESNLIAKKFTEIFPHFFNSKIKSNLNERERHDRLGKNKNKFYVVSKKRFIQYFIDLTKKKNLTKYRVIKYLHLAYSLAAKGKKGKKKIILMHTHLHKFTEKFAKYLNFKNVSIIFTYRHPVASISSAVKNWLAFRDGKSFFPGGLYFQFNIVTNGISDLIKLKQKIYIIQLEKLHRENRRVISDFCRVYKIKYESSMKECTFLGYKWWGDSVSGRWLNGINKNFQNKIDKNFFFDRDIKFIENTALNIMKKYKYKSKLSKQNLIFNLLPMKSEILVWKNTLKHFFRNKSKNGLKYLISIPYFYVKRIFLINCCTNKISFYPYSLGSKIF